MAISNDYGDSALYWIAVVVQSTAWQRFGTKPLLH